ncbi:unnamed protein product [Closterium sp. Yama58-4]|nr:unnamed protein product [Closterium sp. Yama58-4]
MSAVPMLTLASGVRKAAHPLRTYYAPLMRARVMDARPQPPTLLHAFIPRCGPPSLLSLSLRSPGANTIFGGAFPSTQSLRCCCTRGAASAALAASIGGVWAAHSPLLLHPCAWWAFMHSHTGRHTTTGTCDFSTLPLHPASPPRLSPPPLPSASPPHLSPPPLPPTSPLRLSPPPLPSASPPTSPLRLSPPPLPPASSVRLSLPPFLSPRNAPPGAEEVAEEVAALAELCLLLPGVDVCVNLIASCMSMDSKRILFPHPPNLEPCNPPPPEPLRARTFLAEPQSVKPHLAEAQPTERQQGVACGM